MFQTHPQFGYSFMQSASLGRQDWTNEAIQRAIRLDKLMLFILMPFWIFCIKRRYQDITQTLTDIEKLNFPI